MNDFLSKIAPAIIGKSDSFLTKLSKSVLNKEIPQVVEENDLINVRGVNLSKKEINEILKPIFFGEVSNRDTGKKELEARVILNTVINRMSEHKNFKGKEKSLKDILTEKNQYQAYEGEQYNQYIKGEMNDLTKSKKAETDSIIDKLTGELSSGKFEDNTEGSFYYIHNPDSTISYDKERPLFNKKS